ncbi:MAG TPA: glycosyltransferase family 39 protein, partial [Terriglobales bacterium]
PLHIQAGLDEWRRGSFRFIADHPPLAHLLPTLPLAHNSDVKLTWVFKPFVADLVAASPSPEYIALRSRLVILMFGVALMLLVWYQARQMFSEGAANFALALFAFSPSLIAHFSIVATDGVTTFSMFLVVVLLLRFRRQPSWRNAALLGLALGLLLLSKLHTPPFVLLALLFMLVARRADLGVPRLWRWRQTAFALGVAVLLLWAGYFFHVTHFTTAHDSLFATFPPDPKPAPLNVVMLHKIDAWVPAGEYVCGFIQTLQHNSGGHAKFAMGARTFGYMPLLFPLVIALKWPPVVLVLLGCSVVLFALRKLKPIEDWQVLVAFPVALLGLAMASQIASGERHLLPAYPIVLLFAAGTWEYARRSVRNRVLMPVLFLAAIANAADVSRYAPAYLSYFNPLIRPNETYKYLAGSDLDWGQGMLALKHYQDEHSDEKLFVAFVGVAQPSVYGIRATLLPPNQPQAGTIVIGASNLAGYASREDCGYCWVQKYPLKTVLNHSMFVYDVPALP